MIVSGRLDLPADLPLLQDPEARVIIATGAEHELEGVAGAGRPTCAPATTCPLLLARLREEHGVRSVLCEGGPTLNSHLLAAGLVDELFLSTLAAARRRGATPSRSSAGRQLPEPPRAELVWLCEGGGDLFSRWRLHAR